MPSRDGAQKKEDIKIQIPMDAHFNIESDFTMLINYTKRNAPFFFMFFAHTESFNLSFEEYPAGAPSSNSFNKSHL